MRGRARRRRPPPMPAKPRPKPSPKRAQRRGGRAKKQEKMLPRQRPRAPGPTVLPSATSRRRPTRISLSRTVSIQRPGKRRNRNSRPSRERRRLWKGRTSSPVDFQFARRSQKFTFSVCTLHREKRQPENQRLTESSGLEKKFGGQGQADG